MSQLIHQEQFRASGQDGVQVHLREHAAARHHLEGSYPGQPFGQGILVLGATVAQTADDHIAAGGLLAARGFQQGAGLADPG